MKKIIFDARLSTHPGIGRYLVTLVKAMLQEKSDFKFTLLGGRQTVKTFEKEDVLVKECNIPIYSLKEQLTMHSYFQGYDLCHVPHFNTPWKSDVPLVVTIHDLIYFHVKEYVPFPGALQILDWKISNIAKKAKAVIAVSEATQMDCVERYPEMKSKIRVIHEASFLDQALGGPPNNQSDRVLPDRFILSVGSIREHKNTHVLVRAYEKLVKKQSLEEDLVLVGRLDPRFGAKYGFSELIRQNPRIHHIADANDAMLAHLYQKATCVVMPSAYEGFGLPVLEAMASGAPVIVSDAPALVEVAGEAALCFARGHVDELSGVLYNVLSDKELQQNLIQAGQRRACEFSWQKAAKETLKTYQEVLE